MSRAERDKIVSKFSSKEMKLYTHLLYGGYAFLNTRQKIHYWKLSNFKDKFGTNSGRWCLQVKKFEKLGLIEIEDDIAKLKAEVKNAA